jgi:2-polyprenyl-6-methoxyphenol hydroxylase-like FAD-dependent oxidoreductase
MSWPIGSGEVSLFFSPTGLLVVAPLPDGSFRLVATMDVAPETVTLADVQALVDERGSQASRAGVTDIVWSSRFRVHHRLASTYREERILLMGDAAHVHSPAGGQGMNTGLVDAVVLGKALTAVIRDGASVATLDRYAKMRRPAAKKVLALASTLTRMATVRPLALRMARNALLRLLNKVPAFKAKLALQLSGIARRHLASFDVLASEVARVRRLEDATARSPTVLLTQAQARVPAVPLAPIPAAGAMRLVAPQTRA